MNLVFYKDQTEKDIRITLEELMQEAEDFAYLSNASEEQKLKDLYMQKAREKKAEMKWLVKTHYEKNPSNKLLEGVTKETAYIEKHCESSDNSPELKRLAHIKNLIRKGRWLSTKKPTIVKASEFVC